MSPAAGAAPPDDGDAGAPGGTPDGTLDGTLDGAVELLERALAYTRGTLAQVRPEHLGRTTPCDPWTLADLLAHMEDALDAFTEAAAGYVDVRPPPPTTSRVDALRVKACALLAAWLAAPPRAIVVGDARLGAPLLVSTAALEITLHGWDVGRTTGAAAPVPDDLARGLLGVARGLLDGPGRAPHFGPARPVAAGASPGERLLGWTGRLTEPPRPNRHVYVARAGLAS